MTPSIRTRIEDALREQFKYRSATVEAITGCVVAALRGVPLEPQPERIIQIAVVQTDLDGGASLIGLDNIGRTWTRPLSGYVTHTGWRLLADAALPATDAPAHAETV